MTRRGLLFLAFVLLYASTNAWIAGGRLAEYALQEDQTVTIVTVPAQQTPAPAPSSTTAPAVPDRCQRGAVTLDTVREGARYAELRYSPGCGVAWVRGEAHATRVRAYRAGRVRGEQQHGPEWGITPPVDARGASVEACLYTAYGTEWLCTERIAR